MRICLMPMIAAVLAAGAAFSARASDYPIGQVLNLDINDAQDGLIPNRAFYPLYLPVGTLEIKTMLNQSMLEIPAGQGLDIPHSSLIQPDGSEWVVTIKLGARPDGGDGLVLTQGDEEYGYAIYLKDGAPRAVVRTGNCAMILREDRSMGITDCRKQMTSIELRIRKDSARMTVNRSLAASVVLEGPLDGDYMPIHIGSQAELPPILKNIPGIDPQGFSGAISSLSIWRQ